jgi:uncharacterized membrane protein YccF (DUF307 family)
MIVRALWFLLVGWWLGAIWSLVAYVLCLTIIGLPIGVYMLNRLPKVLTLKPVEIETRQVVIEGRPVDVSGVPEEFPFLIRALWFFVLGWHLAAYALAIGYLLCLTIIGIPAGAWLLNRIPLILTLKRA